MLLNNSHLLEKSLHGPQMVCMQYPLVSNVLIFTQHALGEAFEFCSTSRHNNPVRESVSKSEVEYHNAK